MAAPKKNKKETPVMPSDKDGKLAALNNAIAMIEKSYGKGAVMRLGQAPSYKVDSIPTGSLTLDRALGVGGLPKGRIIEIYGPESSGKTTVALHVAAETQKLGGNVAFIDVEHALDPAYAKGLGVNIDELLVSQPDSGEQALEIAEALVRSGAIDCLVIDSVAAMTTRAEIEGEMGDTHVGLLARLMSQAMRKLTAVISKSNCVAIFINQIREKIGVMYGNPETTPGGRALKFYASVRIEVRGGEPIESSGKQIGRRTKCKVVKNKVAPPFKKCEFDMIFGQGIDRFGEVLDLAIDADIVKKSGSWFSFDGDRIAQGRENTRNFFKENPDRFEKVETLLKKFLDQNDGKDNPDEPAATAAKTDLPDVDIDEDEEFTPIQTSDVRG
ncbi:MAG: recombinase RecA [Ruminococcus sp.]|jgi:recombination protein RecA|nr:recombinase RecA [Ruminococcus sp.]